MRARLALMILVLTSLVIGSAPVAAQDDPAVSSTTLVVREADSPVNDIVPQPNSGQGPDSANDPGGWQQYLVFGFIVAGLAAIVLLVRRESQRARAARAQ